MNDIDKLVEENLPLAIHVCRRMTRRMSEADFDEAMSDAMLGLLLAAKGFDPDRGFSFATYAHRAIRTNILKGLQSRGRASVRGRFRDAVKYEANFGGEAVTFVPITQAGDAFDPESVVIAREESERLTRLIESTASMDPRIAYILTARRSDRRTLEAIAKNLKLSKVRVQQLYKTGLDYLREKLNVGEPQTRTSASKSSVHKRRKGRRALSGPAGSRHCALPQTG